MLSSGIIQRIDVFDVTCFAANVDPHTLLVLTEEELVAVDLLTDGWPTYRLPYLASVDARSPVTSVLHVAGISETLWNNIINAGNKQFSQSSPRVSCGITHFS